MDGALVGTGSHNPSMVLVETGARNETQVFWSFWNSLRMPYLLVLSFNQWWAGISNCIIGSMVSRMVPTVHLTVVLRKWKNWLWCITRVLKSWKHTNLLPIKLLVFHFVFHENHRFFEVLKKPWNWQFLISIFLVKICQNAKRKMAMWKPF